MSEVHVLVKGRFVDLKGVGVRSVGANAYELTIPTDAALLKRARRGADLESWDGALFLLDGEETSPAVGSGVKKGGVLVTVWTG